MTFKTEPRVRETSQTQGQGTYTLDGAPVGYQAFASLGANNHCPYFATDGTNWEEGIGKVLTGPARLERTHVLDSSNAGAAVDWGVGTRTLRCGPIASLSFPRFLSKDAGGSGTTTLTMNEQLRHFIEFTGVLTGNQAIAVDATPWLCTYFNNTTGAFTFTAKVAGQAGVVIPQGRRASLYCDGVDLRAAAPIVASISGSASEFPTGTAMIFRQTTPPVGWTKGVTHDNKGLRIVTGTVGSGGVNGFTTIFGAGKLSGGHTLTVAQTPSHSHPSSTATGHSGGDGLNVIRLSNANVAATVGGVNVAAEGGGGAHDHTLQLDLAYVDVSEATKD